MSKRLLFFVNPNAGHAAVQASVVPIAQRFTQEGWDLVLHPTSGPEEITRVIAERGSEFDLIMSAGGDGTLHETVSGLMQLTQRPVLGYLPAGTVNDVATTLELPKEPMAAAEAVLTGRPVRFDIGRFNADYFVYVAAFGAFSAVAYSTPQQDKRVWGRLAYLAEGVKSLSEIRPIHCHFTVNGTEYEDDLIFGMVCSTRSVGGFDTGSAVGLEVSLSDGLFEIILVRSVHNLHELNRLGTALLTRELSDDLFYSFQSSDFSISFDSPVPWTLDGEFGGDVMQADLHSCRQAVTIMIPKAAEPPAEPATEAADAEE